jgi:peptidyl-prolyl cis-trans isomerase B (cyclophilin B)
VTTTTTEATGTTTTTETTATTETTVTETAPAPPPAPATITEEKKPMDNKDKVAVLKTTAGDIEIRFFPDVAPNHVKNFIELSEKGFYNGTKFHRVIPGFMVQGGDPNTKSGDPMSWGTGGSGKNLKAEFNRVPHKRGIVSMARAQSPDSASSQFFIVVKDSNFLDNQYTVFGQVTKGMDVADKIVNTPRGANDRPNNPTEIQSVTIRPARDDERGPAPK